ncbi:iron ABC transporter permease [Pelagibacteraceae bacterium]|nr:iron ABC transporter permease [Pelagibacteraceae bacterium]
MVAYKGSVVSSWNIWSVPVGIISLIIISPVLAIFYSALLGDTTLWPHLFSTVLPRYLLNTLLLMLGVGSLSLVFGISTAWLVSRYEFPGRSIFEWALLLPAAVPAYIIAYTYTDLLEYAGPVQGYLREIFNWQNSQDYWFPNIRSLEGAVLVMSSVLYPYVYLLTRASFITLPISYFQTSAIYGRKPFYAVALPLARPAIIAGLALVLMETISDFGTVDYFAIETLTLGVFNVWLGMNSLSGAAQISSILFFIVVILLTLELIARRNHRFYEKHSRQESQDLEEISNFQKILFFITCLIPLILGFIIPVSVLINFVLKGYAVVNISEVVDTAITSISISFVASTTIMLLSFIMVVVATYKSNTFQKTLIFLASCGYAFPGTILAVGVVVFVGWLNDIFYFRMSYFIGGFVILIFAYTLRFLAIGNGSIRSGVTRINPNLIDASRTMGRSFLTTMKKVILPLTYTNILVGGILVFVDILKELPITLLLRPFNFETLATYVYQYASDEMLEESSFAALIIILAGLGPVIFLSRTIKKYSTKTN